MQYCQCCTRKYLRNLGNGKYEPRAQKKKKKLWEIRSGQIWKTLERKDRERSQERVLLERRPERKTSDYEKEEMLRRNKEYEQRETDKQEHTKEISPAKSNKVLREKLERLKTQRSRPEKEKKGKKTEQKAPQKDNITRTEEFLNSISKTFLASNSEQVTLIPSHMSTPNPPTPLVVYSPSLPFPFSHSSSSHSSSSHSSPSSSGLSTQPLLPTPPTRHFIQTVIDQNSLYPTIYDEREQYHAVPSVVDSNTQHFNHTYVEIQKSIDAMRIYIGFSFAVPTSNPINYTPNNQATMLNSYLDRISSQLDTLILIETPTRITIDNPTYSSTLIDQNKSTLKRARSDAEMDSEGPYKRRK
jgi:hypothetical protein